MDWRTWIYDTLHSDEDILALFPGGIHSTLENDATPDLKPFAVIRMTDMTGDVGSFQDAVVWVHDTPDGYTQIDERLAAIREKLVGQVSELGAITALWQGDGPDVADDKRGTLVRSSFYRLVGGDLDGNGDD